MIFSSHLFMNLFNTLIHVSQSIFYSIHAYALVIMCGSKKAAERILENVTNFLEKKLFLKVNKDKTKILHASEKSQFLGFGFTTRVNQKKRMQYPTQKYFAIVHEKKRTKFIKRIKLI